MLRKPSRNIPAKSARRRPARLNLESLEQRQMLSASSFTTDFTRLSAFVNKAGTSTNSGYTPAQIRTAYGFNNVSFGSTAANGAGQTIAIIDAYNDPNIASDLATFDAAYGIAAPPSFTVVNQSGGSSLPSTDSSAGWEVEESLDVEWAHAIAPGANIILVEANSPTDTNLFDAVNYAAQSEQCVGNFHELGQRRQLGRRFERSSLGRRIPRHAQRPSGSHICRLVGRRRPSQFPGRIAQRFGRGWNRS